MPKSSQHQDSVEAAAACAPPYRRFALLLGGMLLCSFPLIAVGLKSFHIRDFAVFGFPLAHYHKAAFWSGNFPLWNPLNFCGIPHFAQWNSMLLYPGSLLYLLLPLPWSLNVFCLVHQFIAGLGMHRLSQSLSRDRQAATIAGVAFAFGGLTLTALMWPNNIAALGLLPWVIWITRRASREGGRATPLAVLVGACQMLTGAPEVILVTWIFVGALHLAELGPSMTERLASAGRLVSIILLVALVAAVQLLPFFELLEFADRAGGGNTTNWSASPSCWVNFFVPGYQGVGTELGFPLNHFQKWTLSFYPGMLILLCAPLAFSRNQRVPLLLACLALGGLALASGHYSAAYKGLASVLPLDVMRFPVKFILFPVIALPLLAAHGWSRISLGLASRRAVGMTVVASFILFAMAVALDQSSGVARPEREGKWLEASFRGGFLLAAAVTLFLKIRKSAAILWLLPFLLWADLLWHLPALTSSIDSAAYRFTNTALARPPARITVTRDAWAKLYALDSTDGAAVLNTNRQGRTALWNLPRGEAKVGGFLSLTPPLAHEVSRIIEGDDRKSIRPRMADFVGVGKLGRWQDGVMWEDRPAAAALISSGQRPVRATVEENLERLQQSDFDPFAIVCLDKIDPSLFAENPAKAEIKNISFTAHEIRFHARAINDSIAVIAQSWYPAWKAYVNGRSTRISRANLQFQAIPLPAGNSEITLRYEDRSFRLGLILSLAGLIVTGVLWWRTSPRPSDDQAAGVGKCQRLVAGK